MPARSAKAPTPAEPAGAGTRRRGERGTSAVEFVIIAPVFLLTIFVILQGGLYLFGRNVAQSAAREGVSYLRLAGNNPDPNSFLASAEGVTEGYAGKIGRLHDVHAQGFINPRSGRVSMVVSGTVAVPLGGDVTITQTSSATLEQFRGDTRDGSQGGTP